jgi:hypothetical protein
MYETINCPCCKKQISLNIDEGLAKPHEPTSLRDQFAMAALMGIVDLDSDRTISDDVGFCWQYADEMMKQRGDG